uniref:Uncharacterized protein n=1 Tax=viral metagenome TaxID=1070528 RepID=A0A6M3LKA3_9ZZZZ
MRILTPFIVLALGSVLMGMAFVETNRIMCWWVFSLGSFFFGVAILGAVKGW